MLLLDPLLVSIISVSFGLLLLLAAVHKLGEIARFKAVLEDYRVLPAAAVPAAALILPVAEAVVGIAWLFASTTKLPAVATAALLSLYTLGIVVNLLRGRYHISCGCGVGKLVGAGDSLSWSLVLRNAILIGAAGIAMFPVAARETGFLDYMTMVAALATIVLLYAAANQLLRNRAAIGLWRDRVPGDD